MLESDQILEQHLGANGPPNSHLFAKACVFSTVDRRQEAVVELLDEPAWIGRRMIVRLCAICRSLNPRSNFNLSTSETLRMDNLALAV